MVKRLTFIFDQLKWLWWAILIFSALQLSWWALELGPPPMDVVSYTATPTNPGGVVNFDAKVLLSHQRCSSDFSRRLYDSNGFRTDLPGGKNSVHGVEDSERFSPGHMRLSIRLPSQMAVGPANLITTYEYRCNPYHYFTGPRLVNVDFGFLVSP